MKKTTVMTRAGRRQWGKDLRQKCPRSSHSEKGLGDQTRDPLVLIEDSNEDRVEHLLPVRFGRMAESAFAFFRGTANLQAHDLQKSPSSGIIVQSCGDCHLMNFGGFASPERTLVFDISDFDETFPAPFEWDLKRLATSFVVAGKWLEFTAKECREIAKTVAGSYRVHVNRFAEMRMMDLWYAQIKAQALLEELTGDIEARKQLKKALEKAQVSTSDQVFQKITCEKDGRVVMVDQPPLLFHVDSSILDVKRTVLPFFKRYRETLRPDYRVLFDRYHFADVAFKVVGVGSVGTFSFVAMFLAENDDPLFLQVKQGRPSVLEGLKGPKKTGNNGERIVLGQRLMQSASDIFLGWSKGPNDWDFYIRQLRDMKVAPDLTGFNPRLLSQYANLCGQSLARAHSKAGDAAAISGYLGIGSVFDEAISQYAMGYADQVEKDYAGFQAAIRAGRFPTDVMPKGIAQALA